MNAPRAACAADAGVAANPRRAGSRARCAARLVKRAVPFERGRGEGARHAVEVRPTRETAWVAQRLLQYGKKAIRIYSCRTVNSIARLSGCRCVSGSECAH